MEIIRYTDNDGLKYALSKFLENIDLKYLTNNDIDLLLYTNPNMSKVTNVQEGLDTLVVNVVGLISTIENLKLSDEEILKQAKEYTNSLLGSQITLEFSIVDVLPTENISKSTIYLIPVVEEEEEELSHYNEYIYVNDEWEIIGNTKTNLTDFYTKKEIDGLISEIKEDLDNKANNLFKADMNTVTALGGIPANTNLNNLSIQDILTKLLYPYVSPSVTTSITYSPTGGVYEFGQTVKITRMTINVTKKSENITKIDYYINGYLNTSIATDNIANGGSFPLDFEEDFLITKSISNSYFQARVTDASGKVVTANTSALNFYYPYYYGVIDAEVEITEELVKGLTKQVVAKGNKTYTYSPDYQRMIIAYPKSYGLLKSILDPNGFEQLASFETTELVIVGLDGTSQTYYVYANNASTNTNFTMKFNY